MLFLPIPVIKSFSWMRAEFLFSQNHDHVFYMKVFRKLFEKSICSDIFCKILTLLDEVAYPSSPMETQIHMPNYNCVHNPVILCF